MDCDLWWQKLDFLFLFILFYLYLFIYLFFDKRLKTDRQTGQMNRVQERKEKPLETDGQTGQMVLYKETRVKKQQ